MAWGVILATLAAKAACQLMTIYDACFVLAVRGNKI